VSSDTLTDSVVHLATPAPATATQASKFCHCYGYYEKIDLELHNGLLGIILKNGAAKEGDLFRLSDLLCAKFTGNTLEPFEIKCHNEKKDLYCFETIQIEEGDKRSKGRFHCENCQEEYNNQPDLR